MKKEIPIWIAPYSEYTKALLKSMRDLLYPLTEATKGLTEESLTKLNPPRLTSHIENIDWDKVNSVKP